MIHSLRPQAVPNDDHNHHCKKKVEIFLILCKIRIEPYLKFCVFFVIHKRSEPSILLVQAQLQPEQSTQQPNQITTLSAYNM